MAKPQDQDRPRTASVPTTSPRVAQVETEVRKARPQSAPAATPADWSQASSWAWTIRETIESIVIAFILAFLFRTFEVEAFVIPTGSMATTLMGRNLDLDCPQCGFH